MLKNEIINNNDVENKSLTEQLALMKQQMSNTESQMRQLTSQFAYDKD